MARSVSSPPSTPPVSPSGASAVRRTERVRALGAALLEALPLLGPAMVAGVALVAMVALQAGRFRPLVVLPLGIVAAALAARVVDLTRPEPLRGARWLDGAAVALALGFTALNMRYSAQILDVFRDPGVYAITGQWLARHGSLPIPVQPEVFGGVPGVSFYSAGFDPLASAGAVHPQFSNLLPGLLAIGGWLGGDRLLLKVNPLLGGLALLSLYGLARQYVGRAWALLPLVALGVSLPQLQFSRGTYSEPVTMLLVLGGLALLREAQLRDRARSFGLAGLVLGGCVLARVDGFFFLLAVPLAAAELAMAPPGRRGRRLGQAGALLAGAAVPAAVAIANLLGLSPAYLRGLDAELWMIAAAAAAVGLLGVAAVVLCWTTPLPRRLLTGTRWLPAAGAGTVVLLVAVGASRPLWQVGRTPEAPPSQTDYIAFLQRAGGFAVDGSRSYAEQTLAWLSWYWGPLVVVLGTVGVAMAVHRLLARRDRLLVAPLGMLVSTALLYLTAPSIVPDQLWAMRRYLPVVVPGFLVASAVALSPLARRSRAGLAAALALAAGLALFPLAGSARLLTLREGVPQLAEVEHLCAALPADAALAVTGSLGVTHQQTVRSACGVPVAALREPTRDHLARLSASARAHGRRLHVLATEATAIAPDAAPTDRFWEPISCVGVVHLNAVVERAPDAWGAERRALLLGVVSERGTVTPAPATRAPLRFC
jgi:Dolichyl-phosphate-mannose-protein mannosyltransferase